MIEPRLYRDMGLNDAEYARILDIMGREPTLTELGMFSVMWSEHCGYKYSRPVLSLFKTYKEAQETGALENAGVIPLDEKLGIVFKVESHNHPSAVEPFQGAATGVGGILRDIFTMGARPIANLNSLRFGPLSEPRNRYLFEGVVSGISHYGNCLVPEESFIWRDRKGVHFDTIGNFVESRLVAEKNTAVLTDKDDIETLSIDPATLRPCWQKVKRAFRRQTKQLIRFKTAMGRTLTVTPDHVVATNRENGWQYCSAASIKVGDEIPLLTSLPISSETSSLPIWDTIELLKDKAELASGVYVSFPDDWKPSEELQLRLKTIVSSPQVRFRYLHNSMPFALYLTLEPLLKIDRSDIRLHRKGKCNRMKAVVPMSEALARLLGYYLAEGCLSDNDGTVKIIFTFALDEQEYIDDVAASLQSLGLRACIERRKSTCVVYASSWLFGYLLKNLWSCGKNAQEKSLPSFVFELPASIRYEILKGLLRGDGSLTTKTHGSHAKIAYATVSKRLFEQVVLLLQSIGIVPSIGMRNATLSQIQGRNCSRMPLYQLEICTITDLTALAGIFHEERNKHLADALARYCGTTYSFSRFRREGDVAYVKVKQITHQEVSEQCVYDVEVENTHLFVTSSGIVTHNCVGVPTVAGEVYFHPCYSGNPLVNAMAVGVVELKKIASAAAKGIGNPVIYVGSATGKDGIHGATFASAELDEESESKRPNVQMGDPFMEKLLIEATLEALASGAIVGIQDMGAAGLTCSTCEMAAKGNVGMEIDVRKVPLREADMTPYEIMLSESQERMLCVAEKGKEEIVVGIFKKWGLNGVVVGHITGDGLTTIKENGEIVAQIRSKALTDECPVYSLEAAEPAYIKEVQAFDVVSLPEPTISTQQITDPAQQRQLEDDLLNTLDTIDGLIDKFGENDATMQQALGSTTDLVAKVPASYQTYQNCLTLLLDSLSIASKRWVTEQYDSMVQTQTVALNGGDAAILRIRGTNKGIAVKLDGNGRYGYLDPFVGGQIAVAEAARNVACVGAKPAAITDNLNFANPQKTEGFWQFRRSVEGIASATEAFGTPVVSGNVSFYNETPEGAIFPTPTIGMLGILHDVNQRCQAGFREDAEGDTLILLSAYDDPTGGLGGSEYLSVVHGVEAGVPPRLDLAGEKRLQEFLVACINEGLFASCHDISDGGLAVCLAEKAMAGKQGALVLMNPGDFDANLPVSAHLFGEAQGRVVVTVRNEKQFKDVQYKAQVKGIKAHWIGTVGGDTLRIAFGKDVLLDTPVEVLSGIYENALPRRMKGMTVQDQ